MVTDAFLLTRQWRDTPDGVELVFWAASSAGPVRILLERQETLCFIRRLTTIEPSLIPEDSYRRKSLDLMTLRWDACRLSLLQVTTRDDGGKCPAQRRGNTRL